MQTRIQIQKLFLVSAMATATVFVGFVQSAVAQFSCVTNDGAVTITGYSGNTGAMIIPSTTNGYPVVNIADGAFTYGGITSATIPDTVTNIGVEAFYGCTNLASISIGSALTAVGSDAFGNCGALPNITFPARLANIGSDAFYNCSNLTTVVIPNSVTNIGSDAFSDCIGLTNVTIGSGVTNIPSYAFYGCTGLTGFNIPTNVTSIGVYVFAQCYQLRAITVDPANPVFSSVNGVLFDKNQKTLLQYPDGETANSYTIPNTVTNIGASAFIFCTNLVSLVIPASVDGVENYAFELCRALTGIYFLGSAPGLGLNAFTDDPNLVIYYLPGSTGWSSPFGGVTAELWNPRAIALSLTDGRFGFEIIGPTNAVILVAACTNLTNPVWLPISTNTLNGGASSFSDAQSPNYSARYYRFRSP